MARVRLRSDLICGEDGEDFFIETPCGPAAVIFAAAGDENFGGVCDTVCDTDCVTLQLPIMTLPDFVCFYLLHDLFTALTLIKMNPILGI